MNFLKKILQIFRTPSGTSEVIIGEIHRNDLCFCNSHLKYKKCHGPTLSKQRKTAYIVEDQKTKARKIKIMKVRNTPTNHLKSNLRWEDIGGGGNGKIEP